MGILFGLFWVLGLPVILALQVFESLPVLASFTLGVCSLIFTWTSSKVAQNVKAEYYGLISWLFTFPLWVLGCILVIVSSILVLSGG